MRGVKFTAVAASAALALIAGACGSSSKKSASASSATTSASGTTASTSVAKGTPVKVMAIIDESPTANLTLAELRAGDQAAVTYINNHGGLGGSGHPINLTTCVSGLTQSGVDACTHQAASDPAIVAVVGSIVGEDMSTALDAAGIPEIDAEPLNSTAWVKPNSFPNNVGALLVAAGAALAVNDLHVTKVSELYVDLPQAQATIALMNSVLASWKAPSLVHSVAVPISASDVSSQLTTAAQGSEAVIYAGTPAQMQQVALAAHNLGITVPIITAASYWNANSLKSNASTLEGYNSFNFYPTNDVKSAGNTTYLQAMTDIGQQDKASNEQAKSAWVAFDMFNTALKGATTFDRPSIMKAMNAVSSYDAGGLITPIGFTKPGPLPTFPRLQNTKYFWAKIKNATFVAGPKNSLEPIYGG